MLGRGEPGHVTPGLGHVHLCHRPVHPRDRVQQVQHRTKGGHCLLDAGRQLVDGTGQLVVLLEVEAGQEGVVPAETAGQRLIQLGDLAAYAALGEVGEDLWIAFPVDQGLEAWRGWRPPSGRRRLRRA